MFKKTALLYSKQCLKNYIHFIVIKIQSTQVCEWGIDFHETRNIFDINFCSAIKTTAVRQISEKNALHSLRKHFTKYSNMLQDDATGNFISFHQRFPRNLIWHQEKIKIMFPCVWNWIRFQIHPQAESVVKKFSQSWKIRDIAIWDEWFRSCPNRDEVAPLHNSRAFFSLEIMCARRLEKGNPGPKRATPQRQRKNPGNGFMATFPSWPWFIWRKLELSPICQFPFSIES